MQAPERPESAMPAAAPRVILHADMDAFYAAIEQRDRPELRGRPVVVGGSGPRSVVATASYEARRFGVRSAMPGVRARQLCPQAVFVAPRMEHYAAVAAVVRGQFERFTDLVEPLSLDEAFLDVTGSQALFGDGATIAAALRAAVREATGLSVSVGVAANKFVAKVASDLRKPDALVVVPPGTERAFLAPLPVGRLWGVGARTAELLARAGMRTIADVQTRAPDDLCRALGRHLGEHLHELAHGRDPRAVESGREARSIGNETTFAVDLTTTDQADAVVLQLCEQVGRRLRQAAQWAGTVRLKVRHPDFTTFTRQRRVAPTQDDVVLFDTARALLRECWPGRPGLRLLGVTAADLRGQPSVQGELFAQPGKQRSVLAAIDAIKDRFGEDAIRRGRP